MLRGFISTLGFWLFSKKKILHGRVNEMRDEEEIGDKSLFYSNDKIDSYLLYESRQTEL